MSVLRSGVDETDLVGVDDGLYPIAQPELGEDAPEVGLYRRLGDEEVFGDLGVGVAAGDLDQDLSLAAL